MRLNGQNHQLFNVTDNHDAFLYQATFAPVKIDSFRLTINASANPAYPNTAQISEIELYK